MFEIEALCKEYGARYFSWYESNRFYHGPRVHFMDENGNQDYLEQADGNYESPSEIGNKDALVDYKSRTEFQKIAQKVLAAKNDMDEMEGMET